MADPQIINVYCDESCHLENDREKAMVLGAVWCPESVASLYNQRIAELKAKHRLSPFFEIKWGKVSETKFSFYQALVSMFFDSGDLNFRAWVIPDKSILRHEEFAQTHDDWYYKMYFNMLKIIIRPNSIYHIYLDIKDTRSRDKLAKLHEVLANANYDFRREIIARMQHVHSHNVGLLQLADLLIGATSYAARGLETSPTKTHLLQFIKARSGFSLNRNTLPSETKFNLCFWRPNQRNFDVQ
jgi:hypothetical protein